MLLSPAHKYRIRAATPNRTTCVITATSYSPSEQRNGVAIRAMILVQNAHHRNSCTNRTDNTPVSVSCFNYCFLSSSTTFFRESKGIIISDILLDENKKRPLSGSLLQFCMDLQEKSYRNED